MGTEHCSVSRNGGGVLNTAIGGLYLVTWEEGVGSSRSQKERMDRPYHCYWLPSSNLRQSLEECLMQDAGIVTRSGQVSATFAGVRETLEPFADKSEGRHGQMGAQSSPGFR